jgi:hypothetical protein
VFTKFWDAMHLYTRMHVVWTYICLVMVSFPFQNQVGKVLSLIMERHRILFASSRQYVLNCIKIHVVKIVK